MYAVFGVTKEVAKAKAAKKVDWYDQKTKQFHTEESFRAALAAKTDELFKALGAAQISPTYSNRAEAVKYAEIAKKSGARALAIRARVKVGHDAKKDRPILGWEAA